MHNLACQCTAGNKTSNQIVALEVPSGNLTEIIAACINNSLMKKQAETIIYWLSELLFCVFIDDIVVIDDFRVAPCVRHFLLLCGL